MPAGGSSAARGAGQGLAGRAPAGAIAPVSPLTYWTYIAYAVFYFLNIPSRFPEIGVVRPTVLLAAIITLLLVVQKQGSSSKDVSKDVSGTSSIIVAFIVYSLLSLPFVEWPGSVLRQNLQDFVKVAVFFFFTVHAVDTPKRLMWFVAIVIGMQVIRVLEPLYMHFAYDYWGSATYLGGGDFMGRLSGAPNDVVNPNGLAFVIITALPFLYYLGFQSASRMLKLAFVALLPFMIWALVLTGSRSGMIGFAVVVLAIIWKSKHKAALLSAVVIGALFVAPMLSSDLRDRYMSLVSDDTRNSGSAEGRIDGLWNNLYTGLQRPVFGHGLGTSKEASWHFVGDDAPAHNLYLEAFIETGIIGLGIYCAFLMSILKNYRKAMNASAKLESRKREYWADYYMRLGDAIRAFAIMCLVFSMAQYGISEFHWYLVGGLSVVLARLANELSRAPSAPVKNEAQTMPTGFRSRSSVSA